MSNSARYAVGLDIGSARVRCVVCIAENGQMRFLGHGDAPSRGWVKGRLSDQTAASESIRAAVVEAERHAQISIDAVVAGVGGTSVEGANSRGLYEFGRPRQIDSGDLAYAVELASRVRMQDERMLLQVVPQDFTVDGRAGYRNPRGVACSRLEANVHVITTAAHDHHAIVNAIHQAHLAVEETLFEPVAAAYAAALQEDRARGLALIDIGAHSTEIAIYDGDALLRASSLPVSADHFTRDVAFGLTVAYEDAESLKIEYGCAILGLTSDSSLIELPAAEGRAPREAHRKLLNEILEARAEELFLYVRQEIQKAGMEQALLEGLILTGGGARLNGMCDMAERIVNCQARNGLPVGIRDWPERIDDPSWCVGAGLSMYSARLKQHKEWQRKAPGVLGLVLK